MKAVSIAPTKELGLLRGNDFHMVLAHRLVDEDYRAFYLQQSKLGAYVMLDNSTYEQGPVAPESLLTAGVMADEIAVPDRLGDCERTLQLAGEAFDCWTSVPWRRHVSLIQPRLILTPQGRDLDEWRTCLSGLMLRWHRFVRGNPELKQQEQVTIGLSTKTVTGFKRNFGSRTVDYVLQHFLWSYHELGHEVHLWGVLGAFKLWDVNRIAKEFPWVRSIDTSKPLVYAMHGILLAPNDPRGEPKYPHRPHDFFSRTLTDEQRFIARENIRVFRRLAKGSYGYAEIKT